MSDFDPIIWKSRAWDRLQKAVLAGKRAQTEEERAWFLDVVSIGSMTTLLAWTKKRHLKVDFSSKVSNGLYSPGDKLITISSNLRPVRQIVVLLHECGHYLSDTSRGKPLEADTTKFEGRLLMFEDELEAWKRGIRLCTRLKLTVEQDVLLSYKTECIRSYMKWAISPVDWQ